MGPIDFDDDLSDQQVSDSGIDSPAVETAVQAMLRAFGENPERQASPKPLRS